jgi:hypothetical protein
MKFIALSIFCAALVSSASASLADPVTTNTEPLPSSIDPDTISKLKPYVIDFAKKNFITAENTMYRFPEVGERKHIKGPLSDEDCMYACYRDLECKWYMRNDLGLCFNYSADLDVIPGKIRTDEKGTTTGLKITISRPISA